MIKKYVLREQKKRFSQGALREILRHPLVTEKSTLGKDRGQFFFVVAPWATKISIAKAVESLFGAKVKSVNTLNAKGKKCRFKGRMGVHSDVKKAIVSLEKGHDLNMKWGEAK